MNDPAGFQRVGCENPFAVSVDKNVEGDFGFLRDSDNQLHVLGKLQMRPHGVNGPVFVLNSDIKTFWISQRIKAQVKTTTP